MGGRVMFQTVYSDRNTHWQLTTKGLRGAKNGLLGISGTEIACKAEKFMVSSLEKLRCRSFEVGHPGVVATSVGLHVVPSGLATWHIHKLLVDRRMGKREPFWFTLRPMA